MSRKRFTLITLLLIVSAMALVAWSNRSIPLTEEQKAWIARTERGLVDPLPQSNAEWKVVLSREQYWVLRKHSTEHAFHNKYCNEKSPGLYRCAGCGQPVFWSTVKYDSGSGWPSFTQPVDDARVTIKEDKSWFGNRTEVSCSRCGGHLGHVFDDGPMPTGLRYCINSVAMHLDTTKRPGDPLGETASPGESDTQHAENSSVEK